MNDPHVATLFYKLKTDASLAFKDPPRLDYSNAGFHLQLENDMLKVMLDEHYATVDEARTAMRPFLRSWEIGFSLEHGRPGITFEFHDAEMIIDASWRLETKPHICLCITVWGDVQHDRLSRSNSFA